MFHSSSCCSTRSNCEGRARILSDGWAKLSRRRRVRRRRDLDRENSTDRPNLSSARSTGFILLSEVATLKFLAHTSVPVPKAYHHQLESQDDSVGASFFVVEKVPGRSLDWNETSKRLALLSRPSLDLTLALMRNYHSLNPRLRHLDHSEI